MAEWSKAHDWKSCVPPKGVPRVQIPLSPPLIFFGILMYLPPKGIHFPVQFF